MDQLSATDDCIYLGGEVQVIGALVLVTSTSVPNLARAEAITATVDRALREHGLELVLIDSRDVEDASEEVNSLFREWVETAACHDRVAVLVRSDLRQVANNMRALSRQVRMRSFMSYEEAIEWLAKPRPMNMTGGRLAC